MIDAIFIIIAAIGFCCLFCCCCNFIHNITNRTNRVNENSLTRPNTTSLINMVRQSRTIIPINDLEANNLESNDL